MTGTGGGPNKTLSFSPMEEAVIKLIGLRSTVDGISGVEEFGKEAESSTNLVAVETSELEEAHNFNEGRILRQQNKEPTGTSTPGRRINKFTFLKEGISMQENFNEEILSKLANIEKNQEEELKNRKEIIQEMKKSNYWREKFLKKQKIKEKQEEIEIKKRKIEMENVKLNMN